MAGDQALGAEQHLKHAAMEPTVQRREHPLTGPRVGFHTNVLQWSPPVNGGSTRHRAGDGRLINHAAMEPAG
jgi:hypothetical protein